MSQAEARKKGARALFCSPIDMWADNGMARRQRQLLATLCDVYPSSVDILSLGASDAKSRAWLGKYNFKVNLLTGIYPSAARWNTLLWYFSGVLLCNKLGWTREFGFPFRTPIPKSWLRRYDLILCFYPWLHRLLALERGDSRVIVDTGDVMADRHTRTGARRWISLTPEDERFILTSGSRCLAISQDDSDEFHRLYGVRLPVVSFVPPDFEELHAVALQPDRPTRIGFMGAPSYVNEEILRVLAAEPFVERLKRHGIELLIAGGICATAAPSILDALRKGGARILGRLPSSIDYYSQISVTVNPVGPSTGIKIKSVETLVAGRSLITTRWGADAQLEAAFPDQVKYVDWPISPRSLGEVCVAAALSANNFKTDAGVLYARTTSQALQEILSR